MTDEVLDLMAPAVPLAAAERGERLETLFDAHHLRLYRLARRMTATADQARDLVQDTYVRAAARLDSIPRDRSGEEAWLVRVLVNLCRDRWRRQRVERRFGAEHARAPEPVAPTAEAAIVAHATVWQALRGLPPRRRAILVMHELDGMPVPDVARAVGVSPVTVRWHLSRGRKELARIVDRRPDRGKGK